MRVLRWIGGTAAAVAAMGLAVPAEAQRWHGPRHHRHHGDGIDVGDALLGGLIVGGIFALAASGKKKARAPEEVYDAPPADEQGPPPGDYDYPPEPEPGSGPVQPTPAPDSARFDGLYDEDAAADRCAMEAETLGEKYARLARVSAIASTGWNGASWLVKGSIELSDSYRDAGRKSHRFTCALRRGRDPVVTIEGLSAI